MKLQGQKLVFATGGRALFAGRCEPPLVRAREELACRLFRGAADCRVAVV